MKAKSFLFSMLAFVMAAMLSVGISSCGSKDDPEPNPEQTSPSILVNGLTESSLSFEGSFDGKSGIDFKQTVTVSSNVVWTLSGVPDWLSVSPTNGNGTITMTIYPKSQNETSSSRNASLILSGDGVSATINIIQGNGLSLCSVEPTNIVTLYDRISWDFKATGNVNKFQYMILSEREYNRMTDREKINALSEEEGLKFVDDYVAMVGYDKYGNTILPNSSYYIVTLAFDVDDKAGELRNVKVTTPVYLNGDDDAWVSFDNVYANYSSGFWFDATKEGYCNTYHLIYGILPSDYYYNSGIYAFEINYYIKNKKKHWFAENWGLEIVTDYPNNHTFTYTTTLLPYYPRCVAYAWGVFSSGKLSSDLMGFQWDLSSSSVKQATRAGEEENNNQLISRSVEQARAKKK